MPRERTRQQHEQNGPRGEQGDIDEERSWDDNEHAWKSRPFKGRHVKKKRKGKGRGKGRSTKTGKALFGDEQAQDPELLSERHFAWSKRRKRQERLVKKGNDGIQKGCCRQPASEDYTWNKGKGTDQKGTSKEGAYP